MIYLWLPHSWLIPVQEVSRTEACWRPLLGLIVSMSDWMRLILGRGYLYREWTCLSSLCCSVVTLPAAKQNKTSFSWPNKSKINLHRDIVYIVHITFSTERSCATSLSITISSCPVSVLPSWINTHMYTHCIFTVTNGSVTSSLKYHRIVCSSAKFVGHQIITIAT